jgi:hypothetical protein
MGDGMHEGIDGPPYFRSANDNPDPMLPREWVDRSSMAGLDRVTVLAAYRLLASGQLPDLLSLDAVDRFPSQPPDGSVLKFEKSWGKPQAYTYTALRIGDQWFLSGRKGEVLTWEELKIRIHNNPCWICTQWAEVPVVEASPYEDMTPEEWHRAMWPEVATVDGDVDQAPNG